MFIFAPATANSLRNNYQYNYKEWNDDLVLYLNDYGFRYFNPQLNQWHSIDPLAEDYYALSSYTYVANNPIKYTDPDGRFISEFEPDRSEAMYELMAEDGGDPDCPECEDGTMLPGVTVTAFRIWRFQQQQPEPDPVLDANALNGMKEEQQFGEIAHKATGSCTPTNDELNLIPYEKLAVGITKLAAPFIVNGIKWGGKSRGLWKLTSDGASAIKNSKRYGNIYKSKSDDLWWSVDIDKHGKSQFKVFKETNKGLEWYKDANEYGDFIIGKHKGPTGKFIPWGELKTIK